jgi:hypothetical protein
VRGVQVVGFGFYPATATEFVKVLNRTLDAARTVSNLGTIAIALLSWIVFNTIGQPLLRFFDLRTEVRRVKSQTQPISSHRAQFMVWAASAATKAI